MLIPVTDPLPSGKRCGVHSERTTANPWRTKKPPHALM